MTARFAHLLLVDDEKPRQSDLAMELGKLGYAVQTTAVSHQLFLLRAFHPFALLLLHVDVAAPDHFSYLKRLQRDADLRTLPVILLGSAADLPQLSQGVLLGADDYFLLPADPVLLDTRIKANLEKKRFQEQTAWFLREFTEMEKLADDLRLKILPLGISLSVEKNFDRLLEKIVVEAMAICNADAGTLYLRTEEDQLRFVIARTDSLGLAYGGQSDAPIPYPPVPIYDENGRPNRHNVASFVALSGESVNIADIYDEPGFDFSGTRVFDRQNNYRSISCLTVPLQNHQVIGVLQLLNARGTDGVIQPFDAYHQLVAESLASQATIILHNHILTQRHEELLGFQREMEIARNLQAGFLPDALPQPPGWEVAAYLDPALLVSGDFYDAFTMSDGKIALVIADVCDKGVAAALFMALVRSLLRAFVTQHHYLKAQRVLATAASPETIDYLHQANTALLNAIILTNDYIGRYHRQSNMFATLFFGVLNPDTGELNYVNAGHDPPWILNQGTLKGHLPPTGPAVGLRTGVYYQVDYVQLAAGDTLFLFTDGITDARNPLKQPFTRQHLETVLTHHTGSAADLLERVRTAVHEHIDGIGQFDDITMMAIRHLPQQSEQQKVSDS